MREDKTKIQKIISQFELNEILRFCVGGGSAVVTDFIIYLLLRNCISVSLAKIISYITGAAVGFVINKFWTFESKKFKISEVFKYIVLYCFSAGANALVNKIVLFAFGSVIFAFLCATGTSTIINFMGQKFGVFKKERG